MTIQASRSRAFSLFVLVLVLAALADQSLGQDKQPRPLPQAIVEARTQAGASASWLRQGSSGENQFVPTSTAPRVGDVPGFRFTRVSVISVGKFSYAALPQ